MAFRLEFSTDAAAHLTELAHDPNKAKVYKAVNKALGYLQSDPRHAGLNTHKYQAMKTKDGREVFEAYAQNNTPGAYRIFFAYKPGNMIEVLVIAPHPD